MRYFIFYLRYAQWFKNQEGIKAFAQQVMNWLMQETLGLANRLKKVNKTLSEKIREYREQLVKLYEHPTIDADEYHTLRAKIKSYNWIILICIIGETFFNYFAAKALFTFSGWVAIAAQSIFAILVTWASIQLFENLFYQILHEKPYKGEHREPRHIGKLITLIVLAIGYEALIYYICKVRGIQIEGGSGNGLISTAMLIAGMMIPIIAGYYAYERNRYRTPYKNTLGITRLEQSVAAMDNRIKTNLQKMENHFKKCCQDRWAVQEEFRVYKENYNLRKNIPVEDLRGHFCQSQTAFIEEAISRYKAEAIQTEIITPLITVKDEKLNGQIKELFNKPA